MHLKNNEFDLARNIFEKSMELEPSLYVGYYFLGNLFAQESNVIYDNSVELDEDLGDSLEKNEQSQKMKLDAENILSKAITMWARFIEYMPEYSWMILPTLKDALQALHRYDDIEKFLIQANENHKKNNVDILSHLADFYANKGEIDKALKTINSVLEGNKDSLLARLKKMKINLLKNKENSLSVEVDKLIISLQRDKRFIKYKQSYNDKNMRWLFETNNIN
jgi:tetratricopeptide (TPR) repeat protein